MAWRRFCSFRTKRSLQPISSSEIIVPETHRDFTYPDPMRQRNLPPEIIHMILSLVSRDSLASSSLVCKIWRAITLPLLYESISLISTTNGPHYKTWLNFSRFDNHPDELVDRVICETNDEDLFQISDCVHRLTVAWRMNEQQLQNFSLAVLKMKNLKHLSWAVSVVKKIGWYDTLAMFCQRLPQLHSVQLVLPFNELSIPNKGMNALINLKTLSVGFDQPPMVFERGREIPITIVRFVTGAQNIESLSLYPEELCSLRVVDVMSRLSLHQFPRLRKLCIGSLCRQVPLQRFSYSAFGIWHFIRNQKQLQELMFYAYGGSDRSSWSIFPQGIGAMPSIRRFGGTTAIIPALLRSGLIGQLEVLDIIHTENSTPVALSDLLHDRVLKGLSLIFPRLKGLRISISDSETPNNTERAINILGMLAAGAPELEELILSTSQPLNKHNWDSLFEAITKLPSLRRLGFSTTWLGLPGGLPDYQTFSERAKALCPELVIVYDPEFTSTLS
ncbi:unnamed protein product [Rhizoctonia solani]|nr:unnamed protein product [Rhizoctonia solani]